MSAPQEFKLIVAGGRDFTDNELLVKMLKHMALTVYADYPVSLVSGMARGADRLAWAYARAHNIQCYEFPADWNTYPRAAGFIRNTAMGKFGDGLLAFHDGRSKGTAHMIDTMRRLGKPVHVVSYIPEEPTIFYRNSNQGV